MSKIEAIIYCQPDTNSKQHFYVQFNGESYYLFSQDFRRGVQNYYGNGVKLDKAVDHSKAKFDTAIMRTMRKIIPHIRYIEKEYDLLILNRTKSQFA